jgi:hypothetical protein
VQLYGSCCDALSFVPVQAFIPQKSGLHWSGVVVDMATHVIQYYDPNGTDGQPIESVETVNLVRRWVGQSTSARSHMSLRHWSFNQFFAPFVPPRYLAMEWADNKAGRPSEVPEPQWKLQPMAPSACNVQRDAISCGPLLLSTFLQVNEGLTPTVCAHGQLITTKL